MLESNSIGGDCAEKASCIYLVGAGPGDPELLTVKALRLIDTADVVVYDRLVSDEIMDLVPMGISRIFVGKRTGCHRATQAEINDLLVSLARRQRQVVRLKGGDPFIFGRGAEEATHLAQHRIAFEIVPGITAGSACAAYAGIPLTHRNCAHSVIFFAGHGDGGQPLDESIAETYRHSPETTLVIYMGLARVARIFHSLLASGMPNDTPVAFIQQGTTANQRRVLTTAANASLDVEKAMLAPPTLIIIGDVVRLSTTLDWFVPESTQTKQWQQAMVNEHV